MSDRGWGWGVARTAASAGAAGGARVRDGAVLWLRAALHLLRGPLLVDLPPLLPKGTSDHHHNHDHHHHCCGTLHRGGGGRSVSAAPRPTPPPPHSWVCACLRRGAPRWGTTAPSSPSPPCCPSRCSTCCPPATAAAIMVVRRRPLLRPARRHSSSRAWRRRRWWDANPRRGLVTPLESAVWKVLVLFRCCPKDPGPLAGHPSDLEEVRPRLACCMRWRLG